jgi:hypothetical protein
MASTVLSGSSNVSYTNNTGQNVRVVINYMRGALYTDSAYLYIDMAFGSSGTITALVAAIGRNLAFSTGIGGASGGLYAAISANNMAVNEATSASEFSNYALPTEIMLAAGQTFSATCGSYNIVVIPEA